MDIMMQANRDWLQNKSDTYFAQAQAAHDKTRAYKKRALKIEKEQCGATKLIMNEIKKSLRENGLDEEKRFGTTLEKFVKSELNKIYEEMHQNPDAHCPFEEERWLNDYIRTGFKDYWV